MGGGTTFLLELIESLYDLQLYQVGGYGKCPSYVR